MQVALTVFCLGFPRLSAHRHVPPLPVQPKMTPGARTIVRLGGGGGSTGSGRPGPDIEPKDQTAMAIQYFSSERTPAALISGATLSVLFVFPLLRGEPLPLAIAKRVYIMCVCSAFCNSLLSVFAASLAIVKLLSHKHDPFARDPMTMMIREVPLYVLAVQTHFLTGLLCFTGALSIRMWAEYHAGCPRFSRAMVSMLAGSVMLMLSLFNRTLSHHASFWALWGDYIRTFCRELVTRDQDRPLGTQAPSICALVGIACLVLAFIDVGAVARLVVIKLLTGQSGCQGSTPGAFGTA